MHSYMLFFFLNDTATTDTYTLSLHDALPILRSQRFGSFTRSAIEIRETPARGRHLRIKLERSLVRGGRFEDADRKSTRLNSSHGYISYAVFCLKKKKKSKPKMPSSHTGASTS